MTAWLTVVSSQHHVLPLQVKMVDSERKVVMVMLMMMMVLLIFGPR